MNDISIESAYEKFEQGDAIVRKKVAATRRTQLITWLTSLAMGVTFFVWLAINHYQNGVPLKELAETALPLLLWTTIAITIAYIIFIFLYFSIARKIYHAQSVVYPHLNEQLPEDQQRTFIWHSYFRKIGAKQPKSGFGTISSMVSKLAIPFVLILICQFTWMHLMDISGIELIDEHYAFLGLVDLTLFSCMVLYIVVLLAVRIGVLGKQKDPHATTGKGNYYEPNQE